MSMFRHQQPSHYRSVELSAVDQDKERSPLLATERGQSTSTFTRSKPATSVDHDYVDWVATGLCFLFPAVGGLLFGYDIGATSGVLISLTSEKLSGTDWYSLTSFQSGLVVSMSLFGALAGSLAAFAAGNRIGRRTELLVAAGLYGIGAAGLGAAGDLNSLLLGRVLYGVGMGLAMHAAPAYIAETSPPSVRGLLISLKEAAIVGGILLGYLSSYWFIDNVGGWRNMYGLAIPLALTLGIGMATLPESPRWLLLNGADRDDAVKALVRAEGRRAADVTLVEQEVEAMAAGIAEAKADRVDRNGRSVGGGGLELFQESRYYRPLLVGMSLMLFQQITGQPSVLYYASQIFQAAGFKGGQEAAGVSVVLGSFKLLMTLVAVATVDKWGRRPLLLAGVSGMVVSLVVLAVAQSATAADGGVAATTSVIALLLYVGAYQMSFGPISWLLVGELFPLAVRGQAIAVATFINFGSNFGVSLVLPSLQSAAGPSATYLLFAAIGCVAVANIYFNVPETKGKTLEQIEQIWSQGASSSADD
eukprot:jgi/Chrzof1/6702/Cz19g06060.t1